MCFHLSIWGHEVRSSLSHISVCARRSCYIYTISKILTAKCVYIISAPFFYIIENLLALKYSHFKTVLNCFQVIDFFTGTKIDIKLYILAVTAFMLALAMIRNLRLLSPFSLLSNGLFLASIVIIFIYIFDGLPSVNEREAFMSISKLPVFFSTAVFALEGITVVRIKTPNMQIGNCCDTQE